MQCLVELTTTENKAMKKCLLYAVLAAGILVQPANAEIVAKPQNFTDRINRFLEAFGLSGDVVICATGYPQTTATLCARGSTDIDSDDFKGWVAVRLHRRSNNPNRICVYAKSMRFASDPWDIASTHIAGYAVVVGSWREISRERCELTVVGDR